MTLFSQYDREGTWVYVYIYTYMIIYICNEYIYKSKIIASIIGSDVEVVANSIQHRGVLY